METPDAGGTQVQTWFLREALPGHHNGSGGITGHPDQYCPSGSKTLRHQHGLRLLALAWPSMVSEATDISIIIWSYHAILSQHELITTALIDSGAELLTHEPKQTFSCYKVINYLWYCYSEELVNTETSLKSLQDLKDMLALGGICIL